MKVNWVMEVTGVLAPVNGQGVRLSEEDKKVSLVADSSDTLLEVYQRLCAQGRERLGGAPFFLCDIKVHRRLV